jgi:glycosyltransferase involved in cell wall biosynthesis
MAMAQQLDFSLIIPTYTGEEYIAKSFQSILDQKYSGKPPSFEIIVVIDGPNDNLRQIVEENKKLVEASKIKCTVHQFKKNQGRFEARLQGAKLASAKQLLFVDDRVTLDPEFISKIVTDKDVVIPNVLEAIHPNIVSRLLYLMRKKIYGKNNWGADFKSYFITADNFEASPKGTTSLWVEREVFINGCQEYVTQSSSDNTKYSNDDTAILALIISAKGRLRRRSDTKIYYHPRSQFSAELSHLYHRGPRFIDYYFRPGTRFWKYILAVLAFGLGIVLLAIFGGLSVIIPMLILLLASFLLLAVFLSENLRDIFVVIISLPLVLIFFCSGCLVGLVKKLK